MQALDLNGLTHESLSDHYCVEGRCAQEAHFFEPPFKGSLCLHPRMRVLKWRRTLDVGGSSAFSRKKRPQQFIVDRTQGAAKTITIASSEFLGTFDRSFGLLCVARTESNTDIRGSV